MQYSSTAVQQVQQQYSRFAVLVQQYSQYSWTRIGQRPVYAVLTVLLYWLYCCTCCTAVLLGLSGYVGVCLSLTKLLLSVPDYL